MSYKLSIRVNLSATDSNRILGVNKFTKHKIFQAVKEEVLALCYGKKPEAPLEKFHLEIIRESPRMLDYDNFVASLKPTIDGLKLSGVIKNDSWKYVNPRTTSFEQIKGEKKTLHVTVREEDGSRMATKEELASIGIIK